MNKLKRFGKWVARHIPYMALGFLSMHFLSFWWAVSAIGIGVPFLLMIESVMSNRAEQKQLAKQRVAILPEPQRVVCNDYSEEDMADVEAYLDAAKRDWK